MPVQCQTCSKPFPRAADLHEHVELFKDRARYLTLELLKCITHTYTTGERSENPSDSAETEIHDGIDIGGVETEREEATLGSDHEVEIESSDDDDPCLETMVKNDDVASECSQISCPQPKCDAKFPSRTRMKRHYQTHVKCYEVCFLCNRTFDRVSLYIDHKCTKVGGTEKARILARRNALRILVKKDMKKCIAAKQRTTANPQRELSPPRKRLKIQAANDVQSSSGDPERVPTGCSDPILDESQTLTNPSQLLCPDAFDLSTNHISSDVMPQFDIPTGPLRGSIFGTQNVGFPFMEETQTEARGALFFASRLGSSWQPTSDCYPPEGSWPTISLKSQSTHTVQNEEIMTSDGMLVEDLAAKAYR